MGILQFVNVFVLVLIVCMKMILQEILFFFLFCFLIINFLIIVQLEWGKLKFFKFYIFFMLVDDFGWIDVGYYGLKIYILNLDLLVKDGVILDNFYV